MKAIKWVVVLILILLGACSKPVTENGPVAEKLNEQKPIGQNSSNASVPAPIKSPFVITDLTLVPAVIEVGHPAMIVVTVNNTGEKLGTFPVELKVDGKLYSTHTVTLPGGKSDNVTFPITPEQERNLLITCGDIVRELVIQHS